MIVCERRLIKGSVLVEMETEQMEYLSVILSIFHYFGSDFRISMRKLHYFRRLFSQYSSRSLLLVAHHRRLHGFRIALLARQPPKLHVCA